MPRNTLLINILVTLGFSFIAHYYIPKNPHDIFIINFFVTSYVAIVLFYLFSNIQEKNSHIIVLSFFLNLFLVSSYFYASFVKNKEISIAEIINNKLLITIIFFHDLCQINYNVLLLVLSIIFFLKLKTLRIIRISIIRISLIFFFFVFLIKDHDSFFNIIKVAFFILFFLVVFYFLQKKTTRKNKIIASVFTFISYTILTTEKILYKLIIIGFFIVGLRTKFINLESNYYFLYILILSFYLYYYFKKVKNENLISNISKDKYIIIKLIFIIVATNIIFLSWSKNVYINDHKTTISDQKTKIMNNKHIIIPVRIEDINGLDAEPFMYLKATDPTEDALLKKAFEKSLIKHNIQHRFTVITPSEMSGSFKPICSSYHLEKEKDTTTVLIFIDKKSPNIIFDIVNPLAKSVYELRYMPSKIPLSPIDEVSDFSIEWLGYIYKKYSDNIYTNVNQKFSTRLLKLDNNYLKKCCQWSCLTTDEYHFNRNLNQDIKNNQ